MFAFAHDEMRWFGSRGRDGMALYILIPLIRYDSGVMIVFNAELQECNNSQPLQLLVRESFHFKADK